MTLRAIPPTWIADVAITFDTVSVSDITYRGQRADGDHVFEGVARHFVDDECVGRHSFRACMTDTDFFLAGHEAAAWVAASVEWAANSQPNDGLKLSWLAAATATEPLPVFRLRS